MKKYVYLLIFLFGFANIVNAGAKLGVSANFGVFEASAKEKEGDETSANKSAEGLFVIPSIFFEMSPNDRIFLGVDYNPIALESESTNHKQQDKTTSATATEVNNNVQVDFEDLTTVYVRLAVNDNFYLKAGLMEVEAITNESLGTGSVYGNKTMSGEMFGLGFENDFGTGAFIRGEANYMTFGAETFTSSTNTDNKVETSDIDGYGVRISIGKSF